MRVLDFERCIACPYCGMLLADQENDMARQVADKTGLMATAGSDAHQLDELGKWVMEFEKDIEDEEDLIREIRAGQHQRIKAYRDKFKG